MALQLITPEQTAKQPLLNEIFPNVTLDNRMRIVTQRIMHHIRHTPELIGMLDTIINDHFMGPIDFTKVDGKPLGPTKLRQVEKFWRDAKVRQAFYGQGMDYFVDGSSFGWHTSIDNVMTAKQKEFVAKIKEASGQFSETISQTIKMPKKISYLAASTTEIRSNEFEIIEYIQNASGKFVKWPKEQVVHIKLMEFNGEVRGMSGLKALVKEIVMMFLLKENIIAQLQNGGSPDSIISLVNANGTSKARFQRLRTALESFSHLRKSHGNMPIDADVKVHPMGTLLKDMQYKELAMFALSEFMLALGLPASRVSFLMTGTGGNVNKGEMSSNSDDAYESKKNARRFTWEESWNQVFEEAGFMFKFRRNNLQDDVRETQSSVQRASYVSETQNILRSDNKKLTTEATLQLLSGTKRNIALDDITEMTPEDKMMGMGQGINQNDMKVGQPKFNKIEEERSQFRTKFASNAGVNA